MSDEKREALRKKLTWQRVVEDHWLNGGEVEVYTNYKDGWVHDPDPVFNWSCTVYRIVCLREVIE